MRKPRSLWVLFCCLGWSALLWNCTPPSAVKKDAGSLAAKDASQNSGPRCLQGFVVNGEGSPFVGVLVKTEPPTSFEVTDSRGFFEICYRRVLKDAESGQTERKPLAKTKYTVRVKKDGFHARPMGIAFQGKTLRLPKIVMVEKQHPLPEVKQSRLGLDNDSTTGGGLIGTIPKKE